MDSTRPNFDHIVDQDLRQDGRLQELYRQAVRGGHWPNSDQAVLDFWALAEKALKDDTQGTPGALFRALVRDKRTAYITDSAEDRALRRLPSPLRHDLVRSAADAPAAVAEIPPERDRLFRTEELDDFFGRDIGFSHSILMQCFLPQKPLPANKRTWSVQHGNATLEIDAGRIATATPGTFRACAVPAGAKPRLILPYIVRHAIANQTRYIDLGRSLRHFMSDRLGIPVTGPNGKVLVREIENVGMASFYLGTWNEAGYGTTASRVAAKVSIWAERNPDQSLLWNPEMVLSGDFYEAIQEHRVPINMDHLRRLAKSPRRMDLYAWLSYRLPRVHKQRAVTIPLRQLQEIFAPDIESRRRFKQKLRQDLAAIAQVYPRFRVEIHGDMLILRHSPPPIPMRAGALVAGQ